MVNWQKVKAAFQKQEVDPIKKAKSDLLFYGSNGALFLLFFGMLTWTHFNPEVRDAIGIETYSSISILLMLMIAVHWLWNGITSAVRLWKKTKGKSKG